MISMIYFLVALGIALACAGGVVAALARPFHRVVADLCGTEDRATFWTSYVSVLLVLAPALAVSYASLVSGRNGLSLVAAVFWSLLALIVTLLILGINVWKPSNRRFIQQEQLRPAVPVTEGLR